MNFPMFLLVISLIFSLALLCALYWPHPGLVQSRAAKVRKTFHRLQQDRGAVSCRGQMGEGAHRNTRMEAHSVKKGPV